MEPEEPLIDALGITDGCPFSKWEWRELEPAEPIPLWPNGPTLMPNQ